MDRTGVAPSPVSTTGRSCVPDPRTTRSASRSPSPVAQTVEPATATARTRAASSSVVTVAVQPDGAAEGPAAPGADGVGAGDAPPPDAGGEQQRTGQQDCGAAQ